MHSSCVASARERVKMKVTAEAGLVKVCWRSAIQDGSGTENVAEKGEREEAVREKVRWTPSPLLV